MKITVEDFKGFLKSIVLTLILAVIKFILTNSIKELNITEMVSFLGNNTLELFFVFLSVIVYFKYREMKNDLDIIKCQNEVREKMINELGGHQTTLAMSIGSDKITRIDTKQLNGLRLSSFLREKGEVKKILWSKWKSRILSEKRKEELLDKFYTQEKEAELRNNYNVTK